MQISTSEARRDGKTHTSWGKADVIAEYTLIRRRIANEHGIKTPEYGIEVLDKAKGHDKQVPTFRYNENGKEKLRVLLMGSEAVQ